APDRDLLVLAHGERADHRVVLDHALLLDVDLRRRGDRPLLLVLLVGLLERVGGRVVAGDLAVDSRHDVASIEHRHLAPEWGELARSHELPAYPATRLDL